MNRIPLISCQEPADQTCYVCFDNFQVEAAFGHKISSSKDSSARFAHYIHESCARPLFEKKDFQCGLCRVSLIKAKDFNKTMDLAEVLGELEKVDQEGQLGLLAKITDDIARDLLGLAISAKDEALMKQLLFAKKGVSMTDLLDRAFRLNQEDLLIFVWRNIPLTDQQIQKVLTFFVKKKHIDLLEEAFTRRLPCQKKREDLFQCAASYRCLEAISLFKKWEEKHPGMIRKEILSGAIIEAAKRGDEVLLKELLSGLGEIEDYQRAVAVQRACEAGYERPVQILLPHTVQLSSDLLREALFAAVKKDTLVTVLWLIETQSITPEHREKAALLAKKGSVLRDLLLPSNKRQKNSPLKS